MNFDLNITFNDDKAPLHAVITPKEYVDLQTDMRTDVQFLSILDTDGVLRSFQPNTIKEIKSKETK